MSLIIKAEKFVEELFNEKLSSYFTYHNFDHTNEVIQAVIEMADYYQISDEDKEKLVISSWFHDTGYVESTANHEEISCQIAENFLKQNYVDQNYIDSVKKLISATVFNYVPLTKLEQIMRDADYHHFSKKNYLETCEKLRLEWKKTCNKSFTDEEWAIENYNMLTQKHKYYTSYAKAKWKPKKAKNIKKIEALIEENKQSNETSGKKRKEIKPDRGIDTMFRVTLNNHTRLSEIADSKANILLSVNAIIISISLSTIIPKLDSPSNQHLIVPTFILLLFSVTSIIFAILSTRPKVTTGSHSLQDIKDRKVNLLFFGNFYKMPYEQYEDAINEMMGDRNYLYNAMIRDLYLLGIVLERKYRLLRITYNIFMIGIIVSVIAFVYAFEIRPLV